MLIRYNLRPRGNHENLFCASYPKARRDKRRYQAIVRWGPNRDPLGESREFPKDYSGKAKGAFIALADLAENGGYVCAQYFGVEGCVIGEVKPGTKRNILKTHRRDDGKPLVLKTLGLDLGSIQCLSEVRASAILIGRPQQQTIAEFKRAVDLIQILVQKTKVQPDVNRLLPFQQEVMCSEYLRMEDTGLPRMHATLFPVGRTLDNVDVIGMTEAGQNIYAQVTFSSEQQCMNIDKKTGRGKILRLG